MNFLDIIFILIIVLFAIQGFRKGLIYEMASLAGLILGIYAAFQFASSIEVYLIEYLRIPERYSTIAAFILVFIGVVLLLHLIGKIIEKIVDLVALGILNKLAGAVFGVLKALVLLSLTLLLINHFDKELISKEDKSESSLYKPISAIAPLLWEGFEKYGWDKIPDNSIVPKKNTIIILLL
jgi:membrane protein required for colicin V production